MAGLQHLKNQCSLHFVFEMTFPSLSPLCETSGKFDCMSVGSEDPGTAPYKLLMADPALCPWTWVLVMPKKFTVRMLQVLRQKLANWRESYERENWVWRCTSCNWYMACYVCPYLNIFGTHAVIYNIKRNSSFYVCNLVILFGIFKSSPLLLPEHSSTLIEASCHW